MRYKLVERKYDKESGHIFEECIIDEYVLNENVNDLIDFAEYVKKHFGEPRDIHTTYTGRIEYVCTIARFLVLEKEHK